MKRILIAILLVVGTLTVGAQGVDPILKQLLEENQQTVALGKARRLPRMQANTINGVDTLEIQRRVNVSFHPDGSIRQLCILGTLADEATCPDSQLEALGIKTVCKVGRLVIMDVPAEAFTALSQMTEFKWLAADRVHEVDNSKARETNNVENVLTTGVAGVNTPYDGTGVVVGVIDIGIDFNHVAFQKLSGEGTPTTRIKQAITFKSASNEAIVASDANAIAKLTTGNTANSHGTHTSATAAGSYEYARGMAPGADLVLADCSNSLSDAHIIASAKAIVDYARNVVYTDASGNSKTGKPCVINVSLGSNTYFHDGSEANVAAFSSLTEADGTPVIFCVSAGNEGSKNLSINKTLNKDEVVKTVMGIHSRYQETNYPNYVDGLDVFIYSTDGNPFTVEYKAVDVTTGTTYTLADKPLVLNSSGTAVSLTTTATQYLNGKYAVEIDTKACHFTDENVRLGIFVKAGADNQRIVIIDKTASLLGETKYPTTLSGYTDGNSDMSINVMACSDDVISVGSYMDRTGWQSIDGESYNASSWNQYPVGSIAPYSSYGVDDAGKVRPDIIATGTYIESAYNAYDNTYFTGEGINNRVPNDENKARITKVFPSGSIGNSERPYFYGAMSGTSMATPVVTGIVALWLQKDPTLTTAGVRQLLQKSAAKDLYTTTASKVPSGNLVQAGMGKIDAMRGMMVLENADLDDEVPFKGGRNIGTFSSVYALDLRNPNGVRAYVASSYDGNTLTFTRVLSQVAANTGLLVMVPASVKDIPEETRSYNVPIATQNITSPTNLLVGTATDPYDPANRSKVYVLSSVNGTIGFYPFDSEQDVPQYKAYLYLDTNSSNQVKAFGFAFDEDALQPQPDNSEGIALPEDEVLEAFPTVGDQTTDIEGVSPAALQITDIYDLMGRRTTSPQKGLYIMNGRKVLFR